MLSVRLVPTNTSIPLIERVLVEKQPLMLGRKVKTSEQLAYEAASLEDANRISDGQQRLIALREAIHPRSRNFQQVESYFNTAVNALSQQRVLSSALQVADVTISVDSEDIQEISAENEAGDSPRGSTDTQIALKSDAPEDTCGKMELQGAVCEPETEPVWFKSKVVSRIHAQIWLSNGQVILYIDTGNIIY